MKKYDLVVVGGGLTGVCSAVSARREGLSVLIIEQSGCFGGAISNSLVYPFMVHYFKNEKGEIECYSKGLLDEIKARQDKKITGCNNREFAPEYIKMVLDDMIEDYGVDYLFYSTVFGAETEGDKVKSIKVLAKSSVIEITADYFIDASGDGDLMYYAGCDYQLGRESDNRCQPLTTCFRASNVDVELLYKEDEEYLDALYKKFQAEGKIKNPRENIWYTRGIDKGVAHFNTTRIINCDPTNPFELSKAEVESRKQIFEMDKFLRENSKAYKNARIISIATKIGVRESRKLKGVHILTGEELKNCTKFTDSIAVANYPLDIHSPDGSGTYMHVFKNGEYYTIPYRALLPKEFTNLLVAGRCLSADHYAHSAVRIMTTCANLGEAVGTAIGIAKNTNKNTHEIDTDLLREKLKGYGARVD